MNNFWREEASHQDLSVNHIFDHQDGGSWEARWVQRRDDYGIVYVSSHTGCGLSCRFCHLTATKQTMMTPASPQDYQNQFERGFATYQKRLERGQTPIDWLHVNFMARGEPLANPHLQNHSMEIFQAMENTAQKAGVSDTRFLVSSILPKNFDFSLSEILKHPQSYLYYSLYSLNTDFRKRWLPKALPGEVGLDLCKEYQDQTKQRLTIHGTFIQDQNDSDKDVDELIDAILKRGLKAKFNLVRYNPYDKRHGQETSEARLEVIFERIKKALGDEESRVVPRVGFDVKASCGMFVEK